ncbi:DUF2332 domain-containing protein [Nocardioides sp.]|uniref:DUF2332 domain-containing protein n=1 Tax=Nocardioides sp. TaxID=35761 RepID=UPI002733E516|nr:DUF2332 domain-containing protein [Nocardioides sp.]MDP3892039.1 DUF2332 domain-containing protein [Nocardioides sp.]
MELAAAFRTQAQACARLGSPMYAELLDRLAADVAAGGATSQLLRGFEDAPGPSAVALRLAGSVHRLVLSGRAPALEEFFPSVGGRWDLDAAWPAYASVLDEQTDTIRPLMSLAPQTNEVGRSAALMGGLLRLVRGHPMPVRLHEIGASAGLNLRVDAFRHVDDRGDGWGPLESPVVLDPAWQGTALPLTERVDITDRVGCDVAPVDPTTPEGRLTLMAYVWPDQAERLARLAGAMELAVRVPAEVREQDAAAFVETIGLREGELTVLWHSIMWQYVPADQQTRVRDHLARLGEQATPSAPLAHLYAEPVRRSPGADREFLVCLERWPGGGARQVLGRMAPHGLPTTWEEVA